MSAYLENRAVYDRLGFRWWLNSNEAVDRAIIDDGCWERAGTDIVLARVKPGMTCIDVGANIGYYTLLLARQVGEGRVFAFEPMEEPFQVLVRHLELNQIQASAVRVAVSDQPRAAEEMQIPYSCPREGVPQNQRARVDTVTLGVLALGRKVDFIKIDTDGHEAHVLRGGVKMIERDHPEILFEVGDWFLRKHAGIPEDGYRYGDATRALFAWLAERGYGFRWEGAPDKETSVEDLLAAHDLTHNTVNVLAVWRE